MDYSRKYSMDLLKVVCAFLVVSIHAPFMGGGAYMLVVLQG